MYCSRALNTLATFLFAASCVGDRPQFGLAPSGEAMNDASPKPDAAVQSVNPPSPHSTSGVGDGSSTVEGDAAAGNADPAADVDAGKSECEEGECCVASDCATGFSCLDGLCICNQGTRLCQEICIPDTECCVDDDCNGAQRCHKGTCVCPDGQHFCEDECVSNLSPNTCGSACEPCAAPGGGESGCDGAQCTAVCPEEHKACAGSCIASADPCDAACPEGSHECNGVCALVTSPLACGSSCDPCPVPPNSKATCDGVDCGFECGTGFQKCDARCISNDACCSTDDCEGDLTCVNNSCTCPDGEKRCGTACIPDSGCCGDNECPGGEGCISHICADVLAPRLVGVSPPSDAVGVTQNTPIQLTFSEAMDRASVTDAVVVSSLLPNQYTTTWNSEGTVLTITPNGDAAYAYATGSSRDSTTARVYTINLAATAADTSGNRVVSSFSSSFSTLRRIDQVLSPLGVTSTQTYSPDSVNRCPTDTGTVGVGSWVGMVSGGTYYVYVSFDALQAALFTEVVAIESAEFLAYQESVDEGYYPGGRIKLDKLEYLDVDSRGFSLTGQEVTESLGTLATDDAVELTLDITDSFWSDWGAGREKQLFRVGPAGSRESSTRANMTCDGFRLRVAFLTP